MSNQNKKGLSPLKAGVIGVFSVVTFCILFGFIMSKTQPNSYAKAPKHDKQIDEQKKKNEESRKLYLSIQAYLFAQDLISGYLKSPSSADFPSASQIKLLSLGNDRYFIDGYLDSQNGFGAQIRTSYQCWVVYKENESIAIENIDFK